MILKNLIYVLQSEGYHTKRYLRFVYKNLKWWRLAKRQRIVWTKKALLVYILSWFGVLLCFVALTLLFGVWGLVAAVLVVFPALPFFPVIATALIYPLDYFLKRRTMKRARAILRDLKDLHVIGITGSYGKTTTKEMLYTVLSGGFSVVKTPENINTEIGVAQFIVAHQKKLADAEFFIVEMGASWKGDIAKLCWVAEPDYGILTGINEAHVEKFGSIEVTIQEKFTLPRKAKIMAILNGDDDRVATLYKNFRLPSKTLVTSKKQTRLLAPLDHFKGITFSYKGVMFTTKLLAEHNVSLLLLVITLAEELGVGLETARKRVATIKHVPHRLEPIFNEATNRVIIDDSYNGNVDGVRSGLEVLQRAEGRKVVVTPGLVETGKESQRIHSMIAEWYINQVDYVILIKTEGTQYIQGIFQESGFTSYVMYPSTSEAHALLPEILKDGDTVLFQNDITDNYT